MAYRLTCLNFVCLSYCFVLAYTPMFHQLKIVMTNSLRPALYKHFFVSFVVFGLFLSYLGLFVQSFCSSVLSVVKTRLVLYILDRENNLKIHISIIQPSWLSFLAKSVLHFVFLCTLWTHTVTELSSKYNSKMLNHYEINEHQSSSV